MMDKDTILKKSREENRNRDVAEREVQRDGGNLGAISAVILATVFFVLQILLGEGVNYALYAIVFAVPATTFWVKFARLRRRHELLVALLYTVAVACFSVAHVVTLVSAAGLS